MNKSPKGRKEFVKLYREQVASLSPLIQTNLSNVNKIKRYIAKSLKEFDFSKMKWSGVKLGLMKENKQAFLDFCTKYKGIFIDIDSFVYIVKNKNCPNIIDRMFCPECGKRNHFRDHQYGYTKFCCTKCAQSSEKNKTKYY